MRPDNIHRHRCWSVLLIAFVVLGGAACFAHPMGNFSVNHYSKIKAGENGIEILYLLDMAEIPTYQEIRQFDMVPKDNHPSVSRYLERQEQFLKSGLSLQGDGRSIELDTVSRQVTFSDGAGGLPTMKIGFVFRGKLAATAREHTLSYLDNNFPGRSGWKEILVVADGTSIVESSAPDSDRSRELTNYSSDTLDSPPQQLSALVRYKTLLAGKEGGASAVAAETPSNRPMVPEIGAARRLAAPGALSGHKRPSLPTVLPDVAGARSRFGAGVPSTVAALPATARMQNTPHSRFTDLISTQSSLSVWVLFSAALIAAGLGALHALEPGHGKTIVAAYLAGSRGTAKHAVWLGVMVTAAHTAGVYLLGAVTLYASRYVVPEQLYPWLGTISGLSVAGVGVFVFLRNWTGAAGEHSHAAGRPNLHWFLALCKRGITGESTLGGTSPKDLPAVERTLSLRELCLLGITGGIVPCPAALVVLLSAFSLHRIGFGLFLITAFSVGLAAVLVIVGWSMVYAKRLVSSRVLARGAALRLLPFLSSGFMVALGIGIAVSGMAAVPSWQGLITRDKLLPFMTVVLLGLFLGMRHSTDPDHVVAVSTMVSRDGSIKSSATIGLLWGLGHTLTIFLVGSAIIVFGVVIPPRLGLSMEFCVALMLVLLGLLNLTGAMRWISERLTPMKKSLSPPPWVASANCTPRRRQGLLGRSVGKLGLYQTMRPLVIGLVHGLAGSAAVALLVLSTIKSPLWSTAYLLVFGLGTMAGMMLMTTAISIPLVCAGKKFFNINRHLTVISGLVSVIFGMFLVYHIGVVDGLFTSQVRWIPQ